MPSAAERATAPVDTFVQQFQTTFADQAPSQPNVDLEAVLETADLGDRATERTRDVLREFYMERSYAPVFVDSTGLTEAGSEVLAALEDSWAHALRPRDYGVDRVSRVLERLLAASHDLASEEPVTLTEEERQSLIDWLAGRSDLLDMDPALLQTELAESVLAPEADEQSPVPRVQAELARRVGVVAAIEHAMTDIELTLAAGFLDYAYDMRYFNSVWYDRDIRGDDVLVEQATRNALLAAIRTGSETGFAAVIDALPPPYQQYQRLVEAHRRYRQYVEEGGWESDLEEADLRVGRRNDMVVPLRLRLHAEGYFDGDLESEEFDRELRSALEHYQRTHQWRDNGSLSEGVVDSLNVPALRRARRIAVTLQRWRESQIGNEEYYVQVNIPDFHAEVWRNGNRDMRFRIITGDTQRIRDEETRQIVFMHATPELDRPMRYVVFNPFWNVPQGIMITEYDPLLEENPNWYKDNGYEVLYDENGTRRVRQRPGPDNALGVVKFLFPNDFDVYMHDTPMRRLFERTTRAFSHGCMRIENPMDLAYYVLQNDRGWDAERVDEERATGFEQWVTLRTPIPVHVDYYVATVDDEGFVNFGGDLYWRDVPRMDALTRREEADAIEDARRAVSASLGTVLESNVGSTPDEDDGSATAALPDAEAVSTD